MTETTETNEEVVEIPESPSIPHVYKKVGLLKLEGKRIMGTTTQEVVVEIDGEPVEGIADQGHRHEEDGHDEEIPPNKVVSYLYTDIELVENFSETYGMMSYYDPELKKILPMKKIKATLSNDSITNDGVSKMTYTIKTKEPMDIIVVHTIVTEQGGQAIYKEPVNGKIVLTISSDLVGTTRISATGETVYAEEIEFNVEAGVRP